MAAVQMLAALFHIHSIALSRATVHRQTDTHTYTRTHICTHTRINAHRAEQLMAREKKKPYSTVWLQTSILKFQKR